MVVQKLQAVVWELGEVAGIENKHNNDQPHNKHKNKHNNDDQGLKLYVISTRSRATTNQSFASVGSLLNIVWYYLFTSIYHITRSYSEQIGDYTNIDISLSFF